MTELRRRMIRDMTVRGFSSHTHEAYIAAVRGLAKHYRRAPDQLSAEEVQTYLVHMISERRLSWSTCNIAAAAFRFLYHVTLGRDAVAFVLPVAKQEQRLPEILSRDEVSRLLDAPTEELVAELPNLVIHAGGSNSMVYTGVDDVEVVFECSVNDEMTEASYQIAGRRGDQLVMNHLATVRLQ